MKIGFYNPFADALGGGEKYLFTTLGEAVRLPGAKVVLFSPERGDPRAWERLGVTVPDGAFDWVEGHDAEVTERSVDLDLLVVLANDVPPLNRASRGVAIFQFPFRDRTRPRERARAGLAAALGRRRAPAALGSYETYVCNSRFTRDHLRARLGVDEALVIPPPVDLPRAERPKEPRILSVGRFFTGDHDKRQDVLVRAFGELRESGAAEGWHLHVAGGTGEGSEGRLRELRGLAEGLPVTLHVDAPRDELEDLYARSSLFWHATGFGQDEERHPERLEHFGIATVEAMANGAVPLVYGAGGQREIVDDDRDGYLWRSVEELAARTRELIAAPALRDRMRAAARKSATAFSGERFSERVREHVLRPPG